MKATDKKLEEESEERSQLEVRVKALEDRLKAAEESKVEAETKLVDIDQKISNLGTPDWPNLLQSSEWGKVVESQQTILNRITEAESRIRDDQREIESRKQNGIIHGIPEIDSDDNEVRKTHDSDKVDEFLDLCGVSADVKVASMFRLGSYSAECLTNSRPIKLIFDSEDKKLQVVKKYAYAKRSGNTEQKDGLKPIALVPDRTKKEREEYKKLKGELDERTKNGEENLVIINWKIKEKPRNWRGGK